MKANRGITVTSSYYYPTAEQFLAWQPSAQPTNTRHDPVVYYMRMDRLVKIGTSTNLKVRVQAIGPQGVMAIEPGGRNIEERRHMDFADLRSHLEWFWLRRPIIDHIVRIRAEFAEREGVSTEQWLEQRGIIVPTIHPEPAE